jgi:hypothetical protein
VSRKYREYRVPSTETTPHWHSVREILKIRSEKEGLEVCSTQYSQLGTALVSRASRGQVKTAAGLLRGGFAAIHEIGAAF